MQKKAVYIALAVAAALFILWSAHLAGLLLLGLICLAVPVLQKRLGLRNFDDLDARIAAMPRLAKVAIAAVIGAYIGNTLGRAFLLGTSLCTVLFAAGLGGLAWYAAARAAPPS